MTAGELSSHSRSLMAFFVVTISGLLSGIHSAGAEDYPPYDPGLELGTFNDGNTGDSQVNAVSGDGSVAAGWASNTGTDAIPALWYGGGWGTLVQLEGFEPGGSRGAVTKLSEDGLVAGGYAYPPDGLVLPRALIWSGDLWSTRTDLGTLKNDGSGRAIVYALSASGRVAGGSATAEDNQERPVIWSGNNWSSKTRLPVTPVSEAFNGYARVYAFSEDGSVAGGQEQTGATTFRPVIWSGGNWQTITIPENGNTTYGQVWSISHDGTVVGGYITNPAGKVRATVWSGVSIR